MARCIFQHRLDAAFVHRGRLHPEGDRLDHFARQRFSRRLVFRDGCSWARLGGRLFAAGADAIWPGLALDPNVYAVIGMSALRPRWSAVP